MKVLKQIEVVAFCALAPTLFAEKAAPYGESVVVDVAAGSSATETGPVMVDEEQYQSALAPDFSTSVLNFAVSLWMKAGSSFAPMFAIEMESLLSK